MIVRITVTCPGCQRSYHVEPGLRGMRMRCPNEGCREVFLVGGEPEVGASARGEGFEPGAGAADHGSAGPPNGGAAGGAFQAGRIGNLVPFVPAEEADDPAARETEVRGERHTSLGPATSGEDVISLVPVEEARVAGFAPGEEKSHASDGAPDGGVRAPLAEPYSAVKNWQHEPPPPRARGPAAPEPSAAPPAEAPAGNGTRGAAETARPAGAPAARAPLPAPPRRPDEAQEFLSPVDGPVELPAEDWALPPVRRHPREAPREPLAGEPAPVTPSGEIPHAEESAVEGRHGRRVLAALVVLFVVLGGTLAWVITHVLKKSEEERYQVAQDLYGKGQLPEAQRELKGLMADFPDSTHRKNYEFLSEITDLRLRAESLSHDPQELYGRLETFAKEHSGDPLLKEAYPQLGKMYIGVAAELTSQADAGLDRAVLDRANETLRRARYYAPDEPRLDEIRGEIARAGEKITREQRRLGWRNHLRDLLARPSRRVLKEAQDFVRGEARKYPEILSDPDVGDLLVQLAELVRSQITWVPGQPLRLMKESDEPGLIHAEDLVKPAGPPVPAENERAVFALVRGMLYALGQDTGRLLWAVRVGIDTSMLPVRLPATEISGESVLVLSADTSLLTNRDARTGKAIWHYQLTGPCLGRPVVVGSRVYIPTYDGKVHEIDAAEGRLLGWYDLGQPLSVGGVLQPGTSLLFVPADSGRVFVLDVREESRAKPCVAVLETGHAAGSLQGEPLIVSRSVLRQHLQLPEAQWPDYLLLNQASGLGAMQIRLYTLPVQGDEKPAVTPLVIPGWSWFSPYQDPEKIGQVTDAGVLGIVGINQVFNTDRPVFPIHIAEVPHGNGGAAAQRAQIVHVAENDFWVLAHGYLNRFHFDLYSQKLTPLWPEPVELGSPLHVAQADEAGRSLFLVTQTRAGDAYRVTAVDREDGKILWQRQLALLSQADPAVVGGEVVALDRSGGLVAFDPKGRIERLNGPWSVGDRTIAAPFEGGSENAFLLRAADGASVYEVACPGAGTQLVVRRYRPGEEVEEKRFALTAPLAGNPALSANYVVAPLADGNLYRFPLAGGAGEFALTWRAEGADAGARGYVAWVGGDDFLFTDGSRKLSHLRWPPGRNFTTVASFDSPARIVSKPLVLAGQEPGGVRAAVASSDGSLLLLHERQDAAGGPKWERAQTWAVNGMITAGPFLVGSRAACVVGERRLICFEVGRERPVWEFPDSKEHKGAVERIVGQPQIAAGLLVVADLGGRFFGVDPATGRPASASGYRLEANVAPSATPVAFGPDTALAPLSDGSVLLLALDRLRGHERVAPSRDRESSGRRGP